MERDKNHIDRRQFFKDSLKKVLPILGALALPAIPSQIIASEEKSPQYCKGDCTGLCTTTCYGGCKGRNCRDLFGYRRTGQPVRLFRLHAPE